MTEGDKQGGGVVAGRVSVVIPAYNHAPYVQEAIESALGQGECVLEVVVVDDGSRDGTGEVARAMCGRDSRVRVLSQPNSGPSPARNRGWRSTRGEWIYFLDADDAVCEGALADLLAAVARHGRRAIPYGVQEVYAKVLTGEPRMRASMACHSGSLVKEIAGGYPGTIWTSMVPREWVEAIGGFNESDGIWRGEDFDYALELALRYPFLWVDRPVVRTRMHETNRHRAFGSGASLGHLRSLRRAFRGHWNPVLLWYRQRGLSYYYMEHAHLLREEGRLAEARVAFRRAWLAAPNRMGNLREWFLTRARA